MSQIPDDTNIDEVRKQVLEDSLKGTAKFLSSHIKSKKALEYVYEGDFQADLYNSIKSGLKNREWNYSKKEWTISKNKNIPKTNTPRLVHCEQTYKGKAIDIAIWDPAGENAGKNYTQKDLLLLIEIKYHFSAKAVIKAVKKDYKKLTNLKLKEKEYPRGLVLTFTVAETTAKIGKNKRLCDEGNLIGDVCEILNEKQLKEKQIQAFIVCRDGIIEIPI